LENFIPDYDKDNFYHWAVVLKEINEPIGSFDVIKLNDKVKMVHIGFCIGKKWWNKGIASEALSELILFFFEGVRVNRIESRHAPNNPNSGKVLKKCGMKHEGTKRQADINNQGICDCLEYGIIAEDYFRKIKEEIKNKLKKSIIDGTKEFEQFLKAAKGGE
jgi:[ribosomal protein S5]-alanine N-acetyltransferase